MSRHTQAPAEPASSPGVEQTAPSEPCCPRCGGTVGRVPRRWMERLRSLVSPVRRYRCRSLVCQWSGTLPHGEAANGQTAPERRVVQERRAPPALAVAARRPAIAERRD